MLWTRTSRSHHISGPVHQVSVLVVLDGGACPGALLGARCSVSHQSSGVSRVRADAASPADITPTRTSHMPRRAPRDRHDPSSVVPNNQTMERLPVRQATIGMCVVHAVRGQTGGRCGRGTQRAPELRQPRAPACSRLRAGLRTRTGTWAGTGSGAGTWDPPKKFTPPLSYVTFKISRTLGCYRITVSTRTSLITLSRLLTVVQAYVKLRLRLDRENNFIQKSDM